MEHTEQIPGQNAFVHFYDNVNLMRMKTLCDTNVSTKYIVKHKVNKE